MLRLQRLMPAKSGLALAVALMQRAGNATSGSRGGAAAPSASSSSSSAAAAGFDGGDDDDDFFWFNDMFEIGDDDDFFIPNDESRLLSREFETGGQRK